MGISYSLFEEKVMDQATGRMLNADMQFYRLAGLSDIPELIFSPHLIARIHPGRDHYNNGIDAIRTTL